ncbi:MAG TPA: CinA family protein [Alphaproteobacteria bacterium]|jgi:nicotinamide-nucleotide amidase
MFPDDVRQQAEQVLAAARAKGLKIATAESCTGGLVAGSLTEIAGSSDVVERGFVTYANVAKTEMLGVLAALIAKVGAVSEEVARAMAEGVLAHAPVDLAVSVTGIAGPGGGSPTKPVGLVHLACARRGKPTLHERHVFPGDRSAVRLAAVRTALTLLLRQIEA